MDAKAMKPAPELAARRKPKFANESAAYARAREKLLVEEIEVRRRLSRLAEQRRALPPGPVVEKNYRFRDENGQDVGLSDLFGGHRTLVTYFWMFGPQRERPCPMCTNWLAGVASTAADIKQRAALKIFGRSPVDRQKAFALERGWRNLDFLQTLGDDYARDLGALDAEHGETAAFAVYTRADDGVRLFYSEDMPWDAADPGQDPRGPVSDVAPLWDILDLTPEGRGKDWYPKLAY